MLRQFLGIALRLDQAGGRAPWLGGGTLGPHVRIAAVKPRACRSDV